MTWSFRQSRDVPLRVPILVPPSELPQVPWNSNWSNSPCLLSTMFINKRSTNKKVVNYPKFIKLQGLLWRNLLFVYQ
jgi:hypothetical protein